MNCQEFIFDGISSKEYELQICSFDGSNAGTATGGNKIEFTTFKPPNSNKWVKTGATYNEQLTFTFQICKNPCNQTIEQPFTEREIAFIMRWLIQKDYKYLSFVQEGYEDIYYNCQINVERYLIGGQCFGFELTVVCDAPFGWSDIKTTTISASTSKSIDLYDSSDEIGSIYPSVEIFVGQYLSKRTIELKNELTGIKTTIKNCVAGEHITMDRMIITSSKQETDHKTLYNDFNWDWFTIGNTFNDRINPITVTGNCDVILSWRVPRKAII